MLFLAAFLCQWSLPRRCIESRHCLLGHSCKFLALLLFASSVENFRRGHARFDFPFLEVVVKVWAVLNRVICVEISFGLPKVLCRQIVFLDGSRLHCVIKELILTLLMYWASMHGRRRFFADGRPCPDFWYFTKVNTRFDYLRLERHLLPTIKLRYIGSIRLRWFIRSMWNAGGSRSIPRAPWVGKVLLVVHGAELLLVFGFLRKLCVYWQDLALDDRLSLRVEEFAEEALKLLAPHILSLL